MTGEQMLDALEALRGERGETTLSCSHQEATDLRAFCYRNGLEVEVTRRSRGTYRFQRQEDHRASA